MRMRELFERLVFIPEAGMDARLVLATVRQPLEGEVLAGHPVEDLIDYGRPTDSELGLYPIARIDHLSHRCMLTACGGRNPPPTALRN